MNNTITDTALVQTGEISAANRIVQYLLVFGIMAVSGIPVFQTKFWTVAFFAIGLVCAIIYKIHLSRYLNYIVVFALLLIGQLIYFGDFFIGTVGMQMIIFLSALFVAAIVGVNIIDIYSRMMVFFVIMSLLYFIPIFIHPPIADTLYNYSPIKYLGRDDVFFGGEIANRSMFFYNINKIDPRIRNTGPFWEPGAFGGYLMVCFILNALKNGKLFSKTNWIIFIGIISTVSTTAYLALFVFIGGYFAFAVKDVFYRVVMFVFCGALFTFLFFQLDFLNSKIGSEYSDISYDTYAQGGNSRMASAYLDISEFGEKPFYLFAGRGVHPETRISGPDKSALRTNGVTDLLVVWGIPFFLFYLFCMRASFGSICRYYSVNTLVSYLIVLVLLVLGTGELYFRFGFFWMLFFLKIPFEDSFRINKTNERSNIGPGL
jgi:hypothetical protein